MNKEFLEDIDFMLQKLEEIHPCLYYNITKEKLNEYVNKILNNENMKDIYDFLYIIRCILKQFNDAHTRCYFSNSRIVPLMLRMIDGKMYIIDTDQEYEEYKFSEIIKVNGIEVNKLYDEVEKTLSYTTKEWLEVGMAESLMMYSSLLSLPSIRSDSKTLIYTLLKEGKEETVEFETFKKYELSFLKDNNYEIFVDEDNQYIRLIYNDCHDKERMEKTVIELKKISREKNINRMIVDLRGNNGGNSTIIEPLIAYLSKRKIKIVTLVDRGVFSSGRFAINDLQRIGSCFVGTGIGTVMNCVGNISCFKLPHSQFTISCSEKYFYVDDDNKLNTLVGKDNLNKFISNKNNLKYLEPIYFKPDVYVENKIEDYINGRDKELERAIQTLSRLSLEKSVVNIK